MRRVSASDLIGPRSSNAASISGDCKFVSSKTTFAGIRSAVVIIKICYIGMYLKKTGKANIYP